MKKDGGAGERKNFFPDAFSATFPALLSLIVTMLLPGGLMYC